MLVDSLIHKPKKTKATPLAVERCCLSHFTKGAELGLYQHLCSDLADAPSDYLPCSRASVREGWSHSSTGP